MDRDGTLWLKGVGRRMSDCLWKWRMASHEFRAVVFSTLSLACWASPLGLRPAPRVPVISLQTDLESGSVADAEAVEAVDRMWFGAPCRSAQLPKADPPRTSEGISVMWQSKTEYLEAVAEIRACKDPSVQRVLRKILPRLVL